MDWLEDKIRRFQQEQENLIKSQLGDFEKARSGVYKDTPYNRKKGLVGMKYGSEKKGDVDSKLKELENNVREAESEYKKEGGSRYLSNLDYAKQKLHDYKAKQKESKGWSGKGSFKVGDIVSIKNEPYLASYSNLEYKKLKIVGTKGVD